MIRISQRPPAATLGCLGCPSAGTPRCSGCALAKPAVRGLGFSMPQMDWKMWALVALAAILLYQYLFGEKATARRRALAKARADYKARRARIRAE